MDRKRNGILIVIIGALLFIGAFMFLLPVTEFYFISLILMFIAVVFIGIGSAMAKNFDRTIDTPTEECYYCNGTGRIMGADEEEVCPRCGGSGLAREDDVRS